MTQSDSSEWERNQKRPKNYECPCGKSYLSYPALYTHIKQSHGGKAPGQIKRPDTHNRGRPKATGSTKIQQHNKFIEEGLKKDPIPDLLKLIEGAKVSSNREVKAIYESEPVYRLIMNDKDKPFSPQFLKQDRIYDVKMGEGIIHFLKQIQEKIENKNVYDEIVMLIVLLTEHIIEETQDQNVLNLGTIGLMPEFVNYFVIHDFRKPVQRLKLENLWIFQGQNPIRVLSVFFNWMLFNKFTLTKVEINERYFNPNDQDSSDEFEQNNSNSNENNDEDQQQNEEVDNKDYQNESEDQQQNNQQELEDSEISDENEFLRKKIKKSEQDEASYKEEQQEKK